MLTSISLKNPLLLVALSLLFVGCIPVKNVEKAWNNAKADEALVGQWVGKTDSDTKVGFIKTDQGFLVTSGTSGLEGACRSVETNGHKYIIVANLRAAILGFDQVDDDTKDATLLRYKIDGDSLTMYTYNGDALKAAIKDGKVPGEVDENDSATLKELDAATLKWLGEIGDAQGWDAQEYKRK